MTTLNTADPKAYIIAHDKRVVRLDRMAVAQLSAVHSDALGNTLVYTGPMSRDELVSAIVELEFPEIRAAREVYVRSIVDAANPHRTEGADR
jgi:hypothetical protein